MPFMVLKKLLQQENAERTYGTVPGNVVSIELQRRRIVGALASSDKSPSVFLRGLRKGRLCAGSTCTA